MIIRKIFKPTEKKLSIDIPDEYIGSDIEVLIFPLKSKLEKDFSSSHIKDEDLLDQDATNFQLDMDDGKADIENTHEENIVFSLQEEKEDIKVAPAPKEKIQQKTIKNVLIVEDNAINQKLISKILENFNLNITAVSDGLMAFKKRQEEDFDLILMDIVMPVMDGAESMKKILAYEKENSLPHVPIVALTANALKGDREKFMGEGADEYITKPIRKNDISRILDMFSHQEVAKQDETKEQINLQNNPKINIEQKEKKHNEIDPKPKKDTIDEIKNDVPRVDILVFKKEALETFVAKSIISQIRPSCDSCDNLDDFYAKIDKTAYGLIIFDYEIQNMDIEKFASSINEAKKKHKMDKIKTIMIANKDTQIPKHVPSLFTQTIKGIVGRDKLAGIIDKYF
ncbi:MAG: hypothetical protein CR967_00995 [Proteobacteria bacterium]|nr:MAG: hypothetical protein CR967_00995 [Pseudomonadota bacterium]